MTLTDIFNPFMSFVLRSPFHMLVSKNTLLISFKGRKSGRSYTTPVNYVLDGDVLHIVSQRGRSWWRNLRGRAPVSVRLKGKDLRATGEVIEDDGSVAKQLMEYLQRVPHYSRYFKVDLDANGHPKSEDVTNAAKDRVMIRLKLNE